MSAHLIANNRSLTEEPRYRIRRVEIDLPAPDDTKGKVLYDGTVSAATQK